MSNEMEKQNSQDMSVTMNIESNGQNISVQSNTTKEEKPQPLNAANGDTASEFVGLPIESLICKPIIAAAKGQQELTAVYVDGIQKLAYDADGNTKVLNFKYDRPVNNPDGTVGKMNCEIDAPLLSLVPVPAFIMDEVTVDFNMEVKNMDMTESKTHEEASTTVSYNSWFGLDCNISGSVSSDSEHKRESDNSATYTIHARAIQQPPSEGMAKLTSLFAQAMEPVKN